MGMLDATVPFGPCQKRRTGRANGFWRFQPNVIIYKVNLPTDSSRQRYPPMSLDERDENPYEAPHAAIGGDHRFTLPAVEPPVDATMSISVTHDLNDDDLRRFVNCDAFYDPMPLLGFILGFCEARTLTITPWGLALTILGAKPVVLELADVDPTTQSWSAVRRIDRSEDYITFWLRGRRRLVLPRRAFSSPDEADAFLRTAMWWRAKVG